MNINRKLTDFTLGRLAEVLRFHRILYAHKANTVVFGSTAVSPFMYTERIFRPYGSESTSANTGILSVSFSFLRKSLRYTKSHAQGNSTLAAHAIISLPKCLKLPVKHMLNKDAFVSRQVRTSCS